MTLATAICAHIQVLPVRLQREALDYIAWLETRYGITGPNIESYEATATEEFITRHVGALSSDFPTDIDDYDLDKDVPQ